MRSDGSGEPITLTVTGKNLLPQTTTIFPVGAKATGNVGVQPVHLRVGLGATATLPTKVNVVRADGSTRRAAVTWRRAGAWSEPGEHTVTGTVAGTKLKATAVIDVYNVQQIGWYTATTVEGVQPMLPGSVEVRYTDGYAPTSRSPGSGRTPPTSRPTPASRRSARSPARTGRRPPASPWSPPARTPTSPGMVRRSHRPPTPAIPGLPAPCPQPCNDAPTGWSNYYNKSATALLPAVSKANPSDWVSVTWPAAHTLSAAAATFTVQAGRYALPGDTAVQFWDGAAWSPVSGLTTTPGGPPTTRRYSGSTR